MQKRNKCLDKTGRLRSASDENIKDENVSENFFFFDSYLFVFITPINLLHTSRPPSINRSNQIDKLAKEFIFNLHRSTPDAQKFVFKQETFLLELFEKR